MYRSIPLSHRLPDDLVYDILTRLPVKSLIRFRCVSRSWYCTITDSDFITKHLDRANLLSNSHNGYLLCNPSIRNGQYSSCDYLCTFVCNTDRTLTEISRFEFPSNDERFLVGFSNGIICLANYDEEFSHILYLWNPSIRKFKKLLAPPTSLIEPFHESAAFGFGYHSQNNDYKILRLRSLYIWIDRGVKVRPAEAEIYTLSTDSWRRVVISVESFCGTGSNESVDFIESSLCLFFNRALHSIASSWGHRFILSFDVNDERFRKILLPPNYLDGVAVDAENLAVFKGSLALIVFGEDVAENSNVCHIWVMKKYGVVESWTKRSVPMAMVAMGEVERPFGCTINGELLIEKYGPTQSLAFDPDSLNEEILRIPEAACMIYTANFVESLVLLDGLNISSQSEN
ncbi:F-box/kelch-repeat protein At3g23880-like isoform X1 [Quercus robur]|uniref:F-box/kelch-repeat protein At3g23880-like isoform X1 n=1 Tax=Quercus robur TaxID=38942 RepID=UPI002163E47B|nr:F-box/kelch-repeat protein At3g23880-like isoform X1 [Quercus robur]